MTNCWTLYVVAILLVGAVMKKYATLGKNFQWKTRVGMR